MRAITIRQPYAWAIATGHKVIENRGRNTTYRGPLAIHAAKKLSRTGMCEVPRITGLDGHDVERLSAILGAVVALADLVDCHRTDDCCDPWGYQQYNGRDAYHLVLADVRRLSVPVRVDGALGVWPVPEEFIGRIRTAARLPEVSR